MSRVNWSVTQMCKNAVRSAEQELLGITMSERDASESSDIHLLEKARISLSEALVQIGLFEESATGHKWRKI